MTAQHLFWHHFLGLRTPELDRRHRERAARAACATTARGRSGSTGPPISRRRSRRTSRCECAASTRAPRARAYIQREGGIPKSRALHEVLPRAARPVAVAADGSDPAASSILLPPSAPFSIYDFACWARQTFVALSVAQSLRPVRHADVDLREIGAIARHARARRAGRARSGARRSPSRSAGSASARRRTAPGAGSSRRGSGGSSRSPRSATASRTRRCAAPSRAGRASWSTTATASVPRRASRRCGTRASRCSRSAPCGVAADHPQLVRAGAYLLARGGDGRRATGRCASPISRPAAGRSSTRTTSIPTSTTRR